MAADHAVFEAVGFAGAHAVRTAGNVDDGLGERLVERHGGVGEAADASLVAERLLQRLAEHDGRILDGVVHVDVGVAVRMNRQVDERMLAERVHHMVVERHGGVDVGLAGAVKVQAEFDV